MRSVEAATAEAIESPERALFHRFLVDWTRDGFDDNLDNLSGRVGAARADHALATDLPEQVRVVPGAAAAQLTMELGAGFLGPQVDVSVLAVASNSAGGTASATVTVPRPDGVQPGELLIAVVAYTNAATWLLPDNDGVEWGRVALQRDYPSSPFSSSCEAWMVQRRATDDEPPVYRWRILSGAELWVAFVLRVGGPGIAGVHAISSRGRGNDSDPTVVQPALVDNTAVDTSVPGCVGITAFARFAGTSTTASWAPQTGATEHGDRCTTGASNNITAAVHALPMATPGRYTPSATSSITHETAVAVTAVLAPSIAGDDRQHAAWVFSDLNTASPYAGMRREARPCRWDVGVANGTGVEWVPVFNGWTTGTELGSRQRRAVFTAVDGRELMRKPIAPTIPLVLAEFPLPELGETLPHWPGLETTWIASKTITYALAFDGSGEPWSLGPGNGVLTWAASPEAGQVTMCHVPCHGSMYPFTGSGKYAYVQRQDNTQHRCTFAPGPYVASTDPAPIGGSLNAKFHPNGLAAPWTSNGQQIARLWGMFKLPTDATASWGMTKDPNGSGIGAAGHLTISADRVVRLQLARNTGTTRTVVGPTVPNDGEWHSIGVYWDSSAGSAVFYLDGAKTTVAFSTWANTALTSTVPEFFLTATDGAQVAELQADGGIDISNVAANGLLTSSSVWPDEDWSPTAFVDKSENLLEAVQPIDPALDGWGLLTQLAETEYAAVYFDADMRPHFRTRRSDGRPAGQTVVRTLQATDVLRDLDYTSGVQQVINTVAVPYTTFSYVISGKAYEPAGAVRLPAKRTTRIEWTFPGIPFAASTLGVTLVGFNRAADGSGDVVSTAAIGWTVGWSGFTGHVELTNTRPYDVYAVTTAGAPGFYVTASWAEPSDDAPPVEMEDSTSIQRYRAQAISVPGTPWRQTSAAASALASELLSNLKNPVPVLRNVTIVGDPRLELGDLVRIVDVDGLALDGQFRVTALQPQVDASGTFTQQITARLAAAVAVWNESEWDDGHIWGTE